MAVGRSAIGGDGWAGCVCAFRPETQYGFLLMVTAFLKCGDLQEGIARVRCSDCKQRPCKHGARFVAYSCKQLTITARRCQLVSLVPLLHQAGDIFYQIAEILLNDTPNNAIVNGVVSMHQNIAERDDISEVSNPG